MSVILSKPGDYWYRIVDRTVNHRVELQVERIKVLKVNPKSVWLDYWGGKKIAYIDAVRRYAHPTPESAIESFIARKEKQILILNDQLAGAEKARMIALDCRADLLKAFEPKSFGWNWSPPVHMPGEYRYYSQAYYDEMGYY